MGRPSVRQKLVDAALEVFWTTGYNGSSVQDLTEAAQVPKGSFYNHFDGKEALALEAMKAYVQQHDLRTLQDSNVEPLDRLRQDFRERWETVKNRGYRGGCFLGTLTAEMADHHERARTEFAAYFRLWSAAIGDVIAQAQAGGAIAPSIDPQILARGVLNAWQGTLLMAKAQRGEEPYKDFVAVVFGAMLAPKGD